MCQWFQVGQILFIKRVGDGNEREINTQGIKYNKNNQVLLKINTVSYMLVEELKSPRSAKTYTEQPLPQMLCHDNVPSPLPRDFDAK